ncbi:MAG: hypothetical protein L6R28_14360 [Planctomycetes bacterium]|nr:hypothetical protein [Planctomycetota bacterium]
MCRTIVFPALLILTLPGIAGAVDSQSPQSPTTAEQREQRSDQLLALKEYLADLASDEAEIREQAQDALIELGESFGAEIEAALAAVKDLEARTRLFEILETWARREAYDRRLARVRNGNSNTGNGAHSQELSYALSAIPQSYDQTGSSSFQINGTVYSQDRGDVDRQAVTYFDPDIWIVSE